MRGRGSGERGEWNSKLDRNLEGSTNVSKFVLSCSYAVRNDQGIVDREEI